MLLAECNYLKLQGAEASLCETQQGRSEILSDCVAVMYEPRQDISISIDEAMIFKRRSTLKQNMPLKPVGRGIKVWARAEASSGYVSASQVYTGKQGGTVETGLGGQNTH